MIKFYVYVRIDNFARLGVGSDESFSRARFKDWKTSMKFIKLFNKRKKVDVLTDFLVHFWYCCCQRVV